MVEIIMVTLIETSNLSYTTTIRTLSTQEAERIYTFKLLVSKLLGGRGGSDHLPGVQTFGVQTRGGRWGGLGDLDNVQNLEVFFF